MARVIDKSKIKPSFPSEKKLKYVNVNKLFWSFNVRTVDSHFDRSKKKTVISREKIDTWSSFTPGLVFFKTRNTNHYKDQFIIQTMGPFTMIELEDLDDALEKAAGKDEGQIKLFKDANQEKKAVERRDLVHKWLLESELCMDYDNLDVPPDWQKKIDEQEAEEKELAEHAELTPEEIRKLENRVVVHYPRHHHTWGSSKYWTMTKEEPKIVDLQNDPRELYYGHNDDIPNIHLAAQITHAQDYPLAESHNGRHYSYFWRDADYSDAPDIRILKVSNMNKKYLQDFMHVDRFFKTMIGNTVTMDDRLVRWHTARLIRSELEGLKMFENFEVFNKEMYDTYEEIKRYSNYNYSSLQGVATGDLHDFFDKVFDMQIFVRENQDDEEAIREKSLELFGIKDVENAIGVDLDVYDKLQKLLEYAEPVAPLLNRVEFLNYNDRTITPEAERLVKEVLDSKHLKYN
jgi:hypothetical protein